MDSTEPSVAGTIFHAHMRVLRQIVGDASFNAAIAKLDASAQLAVDASGAIGWVPFTVIESVVSAVAEASGRTVEALQKEMVFTTTRDVLSGIWRVFARALSSELVLSRIGTLWSRTYRPGRIHTESTTPTSAVVRVSDFGHTSEYLLRGMAFTVEALLTELGRRAVRVKTERTSDGAVLTVHWRT
jgi:hypothetical protein